MNRICLAAICIFVACDPAPSSTTESPFVALAAPRLARRISLDVRGILPSAAELDAVEADALALDDLVEVWLADSRAEARMVQVLQERWFTRVDELDIEFYDYGLASSDEYTFERAVGEEPLRLVARVIAEDRPWSEVVTADWTMSHDILSGIWPIDYPNGAEGWQRTTYTDGRPAAGVLSTNGLWWRYTTNTSNMNRGRAAAISRILLCEDILGRPVSFSLGDSDEAILDPAESATSNAACVGCHSTIDPVAATLFGFWWLNMYSPVEETTYHPERERMYADLGATPGWFGTPVAGLAALGGAAAQDPRLYQCAVESFAASYWRRPVEAEDAAEIEALRTEFLSAGAVVRPLLRAIFETEEYRAASLRGEDNDAMVRAQTSRMLSPDQFSSAVEELTGFVWTEQAVPRLDTDPTGFRILAGGVDGTSVFLPQSSPGLTWSLVVKRTSQGAGFIAGEGAGVEGLLASVNLSELPGSPGFDTVVSELHWRMYAESASATWISEIGELWSQVASTDGERAAWAAVVATMLRDPQMLTR